LVVLLLMALSAVLVLPSLSPLGAATDGDPQATVIATARRAAIRRGEALRLRIDVDGVWALVTQHDGTVLDGGRLTSRRASGERLTGDSAGSGTHISQDGASDAPVGPLVLTITALGSCLPAQADGARSGDTSMPAAGFDVLACAWMPDAASALTRLSRAER
jgi:hypothetical protein